MNVEKLEPNIEKVYLNIDRGISMYKSNKEVLTYLFARCKYQSNIFCFTDASSR